MAGLKGLVENILTMMSDDAVEVTPSDSVDLPFNSRMLYIGGGDGTLRVTLGSGTVINYVGLPTGTFLFARIKRVHVTGTGATNMVAHY